MYILWWSSIKLNKKILQICLWFSKNTVWACKTNSNKQDNYYTYLISGVLQFPVIFIQYHPQSKACHYNAMAQISEHHSKQKRKGNDGIWSCREKKKYHKNINFGRDNHRRTTIKYHLSFIHYTDAESRKYYQSQISWHHLLHTFEVTIGELQFKCWFFLYRCTRCHPYKTMYLFSTFYTFCELGFLT